VADKAKVRNAVAIAWSNVVTGDNDSRRS